jgi:signal transduction histidine kinase
MLGRDAPPGAARPLSDWGLWALVFGVCTLLGVCTAVEETVNASFEARAVPLSWASALAEGVGMWWVWALLWAPIRTLAHRFALTRGNWPWRVAWYAVAGVAVAFLKVALDYPFILSFYCPHPETLPFTKFMKIGLAGEFVTYFLIYWTMAGVSHAIDGYRELRARELQAARLETDLARARLELLKSQLQPHFLFNTLNAVSSLIHTDAEAADRMVARLGRLLRLALEDFGVQEAPLSRELEAVRAYLDIEQARLGPRLNVRLDVSDELADAAVPTFLLQTLVENAVRHGVAPRSAPGHIKVRAWREGDLLRLEVRDDGPGLPPVVGESGYAATGGGVGLANTRARLLHLYGPRQRLDVGNGPHGGCVAGVTLPYHEQAGTDEEHGDGREDPNPDRG